MSEATSGRIRQYDLYLDESGKFVEASTETRERKSIPKKRRFPSQFAGFLVPRGDLNAEAEKIIRACRAAAGMTPTERFKGATLHGDRLAKFISRLADEFKRRPDWRPVRLVNEERVSYGDSVAAYTNVLAELILRVFQDLSKDDPRAPIAIRVICTRFMQDGFKSLRDEEYLRRIREYLGFAAVRRGLVPQSRAWEVDGLVLNYGREKPELVICDVLSNATHNKYKKLNGYERAAKKLQKAFGGRDWTMVLHELIERVDRLIEECSYGPALTLLAERLTQATDGSQSEGKLRARAEERLREIVERLSQIGARGRDPQLDTLANWLDQLIGQQRLTVKGLQLAQWLQEHVAVPLRQQLADLNEEQTVDWFACALRRWALTSANHLGELAVAAGEAQAMNALAPSLAAQWERTALLMDGWVAQAVHWTDCFEYERASARMRLIARSLETQANLFHEHLPQDFPARLRFDLRAKALGTLAQSETLAGLPDLNAARQVSDQAINEFTSRGDKDRQYQYRCHLETIAGDFAQARLYLVKSLQSLDEQPADISHAAIAEAINQAELTAWQQGFALLHWLRLGAAACLRGDETERESFVTALDESLMLASDWCRGEIAAYPAHSILRYCAIVQAARGHTDESLATLQCLHELDPLGAERLTLGAIMLAAQAEVAALIGPQDAALGRRLLDHDASLKEPPGLKQLVKRMQGKYGAQFERLSGLLRDWEKTLDEISAAEALAPEAAQRLLSLASVIRF